MPPLTGRHLWRSAQELAADPEFVARAAAEFPSLAPNLEGTSRRRVLQLMGAALAMSGLSACDSGPPGGVLIPAVRNPPNIVPGLPNQYATAHVHDGYAMGTVVTHNMGRPFRVQGNPHHPSSLGAADPFAIAEVLDFYDPDREFGRPDGRHGGDPSVASRQLFCQTRTRLGETHGAGLRILTGTVTSPTLARQLDALLAQYPEARWHQWQPISRDNVVARRAAGLWHATGTCRASRSGRCHPRDRQRSAFLGARLGTLRPRLRVSPESDANPENEPALCRRVQCHYVWAQSPTTISPPALLNCTGSYLRSPPAC